MRCEAVGGGGGFRLVAELMDGTGFAGLGDGLVVGGGFLRPFLFRQSLRGVIELRKALRCKRFLALRKTVIEAAMGFGRLMVRIFHLLAGEALALTFVEGALRDWRAVCIAEQRALRTDWDSHPSKHPRLALHVGLHRRFALRRIERDQIFDILQSVGAEVRFDNYAVVDQRLVGLVSSIKEMIDFLPVLYGLRVIMDIANRM